VDTNQVALQKHDVKGSFEQIDGTSGSNNRMGFASLWILPALLLI
jgi:hypothetical protein